MAFLTIEKFTPRRSLLKKFGLLLVLLVVPVVIIAALALSDTDGARAAAGINGQLNYQAKVANSSSTPLSGSFNFRFSIYSAASGGSQLWSETWDGGTSQVSITDGVMSVALGSIAAIDNSIFADDSLYLQVEFDADGNGSYEEVFSPRKRLTSAPYAFNSHAVDGFHATTTATAGQLLALDGNAGMTVGGVTSTGGLNVAGNSNLASTSVAGGLNVTGNSTTTGLAYVSNLVIGSLNGLLSAANGVVTAISDYLSSTTIFGGDVSGTYDNIQVSDDSHGHTSTTVSGLVVANFGSPNVSQWTNDAGYLTSYTETDPLWTSVSGTVAYLSADNVFAGTNSFATTSMAYGSTIGGVNSYWGFEGLAWPPIGEMAMLRPVSQGQGIGGIFNGLYAVAESGYDPKFGLMDTAFDNKYVISYSTSTKTASYNAQNELGVTLTDALHQFKGKTLKLYSATQSPTFSLQDGSSQADWTLAAGNLSVSGASAYFFDSRMSVATTTSDYELTVAGDAYVSGSVGISAAPASGVALNVGGHVSSTGLTVNGNATATSLVVGTLTGLLYGNNGLVETIATSSLGFENVLTFDAPMSRVGNLVSLPAASGSVDGYLTSADWNIFNGKVSSQWSVSGSDISYGSGNVGIGTSSPSSALTVIGSGYFSGDLTAIGGITLGGVYRTSWPTGGGDSLWATSTGDTLIYPGSTGYAAVIGGTATTSNVKFEVIGASKLGGATEVAGILSGTTANFSSNVVSNGHVSSTNGFYTSGISLASGTVTSTEFVASGGITLGGVRMVSWPSGGGAGIWATSTNDDLIYPLSTGYAAVVGGTATTSNVKFEVAGSSKLGGATEIGGLLSVNAGGSFGGSLTVNSGYVSSSNGFYSPGIGSFGSLAVAGGSLLNGNVTTTGYMSVGSGAGFNYGAGDLNVSGRLKVVGTSTLGIIDGATWSGGVIGVAYGGTGLSSVPTADQLLMGNGSGGYNLKALSGTANQVSVATTSNSVTLSLPQNIHTGATPTFASLTLTNGLSVDSGVLHVDHVNNRVGINTSTPQYSLDVVGSGRLTGALQVGSNTTTLNVLGNFDKSYYEPGDGYGLKVSRNLTAGGANNLYGIHSQVGAVSSHDYLVNAYGIYSGVIQSGSGGIVNGYSMFLNSPSGAVTNKYNLYASGTAPSYFGGNVGIGRTSPSTALDVSGVVSSTGLVVNGNATTTGSLSISDLRVSNTGYIGAYNAHGAFVNQAKLGVRSSDLGVGVGDMSVAANFQSNFGANINNLVVYSKRYVATSSWSGADNRIEQYVDGTSNFYLSFRGGDAAGNYSPRFAIGSGSAINDYLTILNGGNVGIGTVSPAQKLEVAGMVSSTALTVNGNATTTGLYVNGNINVSAGNAYQYNGVNIAIASTTQGDYFFGGAGNLTMTGDFNTGVGYQALSSTTNGGANSALGYQSLSKNTTGNYNSALGYKSLSKNTTGNYNSAVGSFSLYNNVSGADNVAVGYSALAENTSGGLNVAVGSEALMGNTTGVGNTATGYFASIFNTTGNYNSAYGSSALYRNRTGSYNVALGAGALNFISSTDSNTAVGYRAGYGQSGSLSQNNSLLGYQSGYSLTSGSNNVLLGYQSGYSLTSGSNNIIIGHDIQGSAATSNYLNIGNILFGNISTTTPRIGIGVASPNATLDVAGMVSSTALVVANATTTGNMFIQNLTVGSLSGYTEAELLWNAASTSVAYLGSANTFTALNAFQATTTLAATTLTGNMNMAAGKAYQYNGVNLAVASTTKWNYFFGGSGNLTTTGEYNNALGYTALQSVTSGHRNLAAGHAALYANTTGFNNTALGFSALNKNISGSHNTAIGALSMETSTTGHSNTAIGYASLWGNTIGYYNSAVGYNALQNNSVGWANTAMGYSALENAGSGSHSVAMGYNALKVSSGNYNVALGSLALSTSTSGTNNVALGYSAGSSLTTGSYNILIGNNVQALTGSSDYTLNIGDMLYGNLTSRQLSVATSTQDAMMTLASVSSAPLVRGYSSTTGSLTFTLDSNGRINAGTGNGINTYISVGNNAASASDNGNGDGYDGGNVYIASGGNGFTSFDYGGDAGEVILVAGGNPGGVSYYGNDGTVRIGNSASSADHNAKLYVYGDIYSAYMPTTANAGNLYVDSAGRFFKSTSGSKYKTNVDYSGVDGNLLYQLQPVSFTSKSDGLSYLGFIAEDVASIEPRLAVYDENGNPDGVQYANITSLLTQAMKDQKLVIDRLSSEIAGLSSSTVPMAVASAPSYGETLVGDTLSVSQSATFYGTITVIGEAGFRHKVVFEKDIEIKGKVYLSKDSAGTVTLHPGESSVMVTFDEPFTSAPKISVTPQSNLGGLQYWISDKSENGFTLNLSAQAVSDLEFDWIAMGSIIDPNAVQDQQPENTAEPVQESEVEEPPATTTEPTPVEQPTGDTEPTVEEESVTASDQEETAPEQTTTEPVVETPPVEEQPAPETVTEPIQAESTSEAAAQE